MTMALLYRNKNEAFFLQDFRITHTGGKQIDAMMKYSSFGSKIGLFFAGDVAAIKRLIPDIRSVESQVNINNVLEPGGPLARAIELNMMSNRDNLTGIRKVGMLGFVIDDQSMTNECFQVTSQVGMGSLLTPVKQNEVVVIGSGNAINGISLKLTNIANRVINKGYDIRSALDATRMNIKNIFQRIGVSAYNKLGISPVFAGSILSGGYFYMIGEQITGNRHTSDFSVKGAIPPVSFDYSLLRKNENIMLINNLNREEIIVKEAEFYEEGSLSKLFDPEGLTQLFDPCQYANTNNVVYIINQWVIDDNHIYRTIDKTHLDNTICNPDYVRLASCNIETNSLPETNRYILSGYHGLIIPEYLQGTFENGLNQHLFDHNWLSKYVQNYSDIYI
ncbi:hypothetical protein [Clostridium sp. 001]|uniref:hypothetical protein n=1 Tax=Clostridium sp. 001 TaxID=1970093 RepID=UPI001C2BFA84|nr:hypothetical protein [Clostridium sp. 001]QXE19321.1 hypothetical protein B5S50_11070 [Clostridium sp. 001]